MIEAIQSLFNLAKEAATFRIPDWISGWACLLFFLSFMTISCGAAHHAAALSDLPPALAEAEWSLGAVTDFAMKGLGFAADSFAWTELKDCIWFALYAVVFWLVTSFLGLIILVVRAFSVLFSKRIRRSEIRALGGIDDEQIEEVMSASKELGELPEWEEVSRKVRNWSLFTSIVTVVLSMLLAVGPLLLYCSYLLYQNLAVAFDARFLQSLNLPPGFSEQGEALRNSILAGSGLFFFHSMSALAFAWILFSRLMSFRLLRMMPLILAGINVLLLAAWGGQGTGQELTFWEVSITASERLSPEDRLILVHRDGDRLTLFSCEDQLSRELKLLDGEILRKHQRGPLSAFRCCQTLREKRPGSQKGEPLDIPETR